MPKVSKHPRFRTHTKTGRDGQTWTSYWFDNRGTGQPDIPLGTDFEAALAKWEAIRGGQQVIAEAAAKTRARPRKKVPAVVALPKAEKGRRRRIKGENWDSLPAWARSLYMAVDRRSSAEGRSRMVTVPEYAEVVARSGGRCEVTGIPFAVEREKGSRNPFAASLDRIDCTKGYIAGNVRLVCVIVNCALNSFGDAAFDQMARAYVARVTQ